MFIKIKAQSSDLEKQYIKERDIFKKKNQGPKVLVCGLIIAAVGGYFYYLNSGNPLQNNQNFIANSETNTNSETNNSDVDQISVNSPDVENQSQLITEALASNEPKQIDTDGESTESSESVVKEEFSASLADSDETLTKISNESSNADISEKIADTVEDQSTDINANSEEQETENIVANSDVDIDIDIDNEIESVAPVQEEEMEVVESNNLIAIDIENDAFSTSITDIEEQTISDADRAEIPTETESIAQNSEEIQSPDNTAEDFQSNSIESDASIEASSKVNHDLEDNETVATNEITPEHIAPEHITSEHITSEQPTDEKITLSTTESELADVDETDSQSTDEVKLASLLESDENVSTEDDKTYELPDAGIEDDSNSVEEELSLEISDQSVAAVEPEVTSTSAVDKVRESRPIKAISNIISNVFARDNNQDEQELVADVIEIDFSNVTNTEQGQERSAIVTVSDSDESDAYQGSSIEEVESDYEAIDIATADDTNISTFEVSETEVNEITNNEKRRDSLFDFDSANIDSLLEGVDSIAAVSDPAVTSLLTPTSPEKQQRNKKDKEEKKPSATADIVKVETVDVAKVEQKKLQNTKQPKTSISNKSNTVAALTSTDLQTSINSKNNSTITIKDLYDQLMSDLDQPKTDSASSEPEREPAKNSKKITVKQMYDQLVQSSSSDLEQVAVATEKTEIITVLPAEENNADVELKLDPNKSLAIADPVEPQITLNSAENIVTNNVESTDIAEKDDVLAENEIKTASVKPKQLTYTKGNTPLMIAALNSDLQTVRELVQQGAEINKRNNWGWTALLNATIKGNKPLVEYLLRNGASPHLADKDGRSPLMAAVLNNHTEIVKTLLDNSADVNKSNRDGWTALSFAAWRGNAESVKHLLQANAFKQHRTDEGLTALELAKQGGHTEVIKLLSL